MEEIRVYTPDEIAQALKITRRSVYTYIKTGKLPAVKIGKEWRITKEALDRFLSPTK